VTFVVLNRFCHTIIAKQKDPDADTLVMEKQINQMVYELYGLTPEEIGIVESSKNR